MNIIKKDPQPDQLFKAFGDSTRLRILSLLANGELCVCNLIEVLRLPQSTVSRHLAYLKRSGLVESRKVGTWNHYKLSKPASKLHKRLMDCIQDCLVDLPVISKDKKRNERCCAE